MYKRNADKRRRVKAVRSQVGEHLMLPNDKAAVKMTWHDGERDASFSAWSASEALPDAT